MDKKDGRVLVCYSSQSGTSQSLAERFCNDFNENTGGNEICLVENIANFESKETIKKLENYDIVVYFISSYGEGEPCDDAVVFFETLKRYGTNLKQYSLFGCGNVYYDKYQAAAIELKQLLDQNGASLVGVFGEGNEANNSIIDDYDGWCFDYTPVLSRLLDVTIRERSKYVPMYQLVELKDMKRNLAVADTPPYQELKPFPSEIDLASVKKYGTNYIHFDIELHKEKSRLKYQSGDHVGIYPKNISGDVDDLLNILGIEKEETASTPLKVIPFNRMDSSRWVGKVFQSYKEFLTYDVEINGVLSRRLIKDLLCYFIKDSAADIKEQLQMLIQSKETFKENVLDRKLSFAKIFKMLHIKKGVHYDTIPVSFILEYLGPLKPRLFSISSSESVAPNKIGIVMKLLKDQDMGFHGVCSRMVEDIVCGAETNRLPIYVRKSKFKLPSALSRPIIFVGAGSGIAPFRGFLQEICHQPYKLKQITQIVVYYGLRSLTDQHYIYKDSFAEFQRILGDRLVMRLAISGSKEAECKKTYVQDLIQEDASSIVDSLITKSGHIYVCGDAGGMSRGVRKALVDVLGAARGSLKNGDQYLQYLQSMGRYREDVW